MNPRGPLGGVLLLASLVLCPGLGALPEVNVDLASVTVEKRAGIEWCVLDSRVSGTISLPLEKLLAVVQDYPEYPKVFPRIHDVSVATVAGAVLLSETVVVSALGIVNTNRFTLRVVTTETSSPRTVRLTWTQEKTDGTIDSLAGGWTFEEVGSAQAPAVRASYRTTSAVPVRIPGQDVVIRMVLGAETKGVLEAVFKAALSR